MSKFDNLFNKYINEETITFNTDTIGNALSKMTLPQKEKEGLAATMGAIADTQNVDPLHSKISKILDPDDKTDIMSLSDSEKTELLNRLKTKNVPVEDAENNQEKPNQNSAQQQQQKSPTSYGVSSKSNSSSTQGGNLQGI
jgi:hypothetical protein